VHSNGTIYFTNPTNDLAGRPPGYGGSVLRIDPTGTLSLVAAAAPDDRKREGEFAAAKARGSERHPLGAALLSHKDAPRP
jgi:hypothetical protein